MDIDLKHLQRLETGALNVTLVALVRVAESLGAELNELFSFATVSTAGNDAPITP